MHPANFHFWVFIQYKIVLYNIKMTQNEMTISFTLSKYSLNKSVVAAASWHPPVTLKRATAFLHPPLDVQVGQNTLNKYQPSYKKTHDVVEKNNLTPEYL